MCGHKLHSHWFLDHDGLIVSQHSSLFSAVVIKSNLGRRVSCYTFIIRKSQGRSSSRNLKVDLFATSESVTSA